MGEVWRATDHKLGRDVALKLVLPGERLERRFHTEIRAAALLDHPNILPIYDSGQLPDGRPYYTMRLVPEGRCFGVGGPLRAQLQVLHSVMQAVAYAHEKGVIHRDLKPANILLGAFGEVLLADWGIAHFLGEPEPKRSGKSLGTLPYLPPEQWQGEADQHGPASDVYALGMMLRELWFGALPVEHVRLFLTQKHEIPVEEGPFSSLIRQCLRRAPAERPPLTDLLAAVEAWLSDEERQNAAIRRMEELGPLLEQPGQLWARAEESRRQAALLAAPLLPWTPVEQKWAAWEKEEEAQAQEQAALLAELSVEQALGGVLSLAPELPRAHAALADLHRARLERAEARREPQEALRWEQLLRQHDRGRHQHWLSAEAFVSITTSPIGAEVWARPRQLRLRRMEWGEAVFLGRTPLECCRLARGSWLLELRHPERPTVGYPLLLGRGEHWDGCPPGEKDPLPIYLPGAEEYGAEDCYVPAGWALLGGDLLAPDALPACRRWIDSFWMRRFPVRSGEYRAFLEALLREGRREEAERYLPQEQPSPDAPARPVWLVEGEHVFLRSEASGQPWTEDHPVSLIDWHAAMAFADDLAARTALPWRLPHDLEWEKAIRGVDGRFFPWGDHYEPTRAAVAESSATPPMRQVVDSYPQDCSVYGVRGGTGNVREWCRSRYQRLPPEDLRLRVELEREADVLRMGRGGAWLATGPFCRAASRTASRPERRLLALGFRLLRALPLPTPPGCPPLPPPSADGAPSPGSTSLYPH